MLVLPGIHVNITYALMQKLMNALSIVKIGWIKLGRHGKDRQYLRDLPIYQQEHDLSEEAGGSTDSSYGEECCHDMLQFLNENQGGGALRSRGDHCQMSKVGTLHCDYHNNVNKRVPNERPQSIILALDPFNFLYEQNIGGWHCQT